MDIHVTIGKMAQDTVQKTKIIVGLLMEIMTMLEVPGVIHLVRQEVGTGVTYQCVEVSKMYPDPDI
jgi:hypothetical protein